MSKITFRPIKDFEHIAIPPKPAKLEIPNWYKDMPTDINDNDSIDRFTSKRCMPLLDGLTNGYYLYNYADIHVKVENGCSRLQWTHSSPVVDTHQRSQVPGVPLPVGYYKDEAFKFFNPISIETPKGYSCLFTHPTLRYDLPFFSFPAIVDTDEYKTAVHIPFLVKKNWTGTIKKGTPIIQVFPFKREDWQSMYKDEPIDNDKMISFLKTFIHSAYKKTFWHKKYFN